MKMIGKTKQYFIGATPVILLWLVPCFFQNNILSVIVAVVTLLAMTSWLLLSLVVGILSDLKYMYYSVLATTLLPAVSYIILGLDFFSNDGLILSNILLLLITLLFYPFGKMAQISFVDISNFFDATPEIFAIVLIAFSVVSLIVFKCVKKKN